LEVVSRASAMSEALPERTVISSVASVPVYLELREPTATRT